jgi:hypothetical protein
VYGAGLWGTVMETIVLGIDGTGVFDRKDYREEMGSSFVSYLVRRTPAMLKKYIRGPGWDGLDMSIIVDKAYAFVHLSVAARPKAPVFLTGYSRGGAGVVGVARRLADDDVKVSAMVLFDPVDRSLAIDSTEIPTNVQRVIYARRNPLAGSRGTFGNCGTKWHAPTKCSMRYFWGTHGALGGVPWRAPRGAKSTDLIDEGMIESQSRVTYVQDALCAREVWAWVNPHLAGLGILGGKPSVQAAV